MAPLESPMRISELRRKYLDSVANKSSTVVSDVIREVISNIQSQDFSGNAIWIHLEPNDVLLEKAKVLDSQLNALKEKYTTKEALDDVLPDLFGIPFAVKDNINVKGVATTAACPAFSFVPAENAFALEHILNSGAIFVGKTNLDQFATGLVGTRSPYGICKNAINAEYISGGSSSGSAVAVALGMASFSLGTDTAGSGRIPAMFNGIIGFKPTKGIISCSGVIPACKSLDCVSIFALDVQDSLLVYRVLAKYDSNDAFSRMSEFRGICSLPRSIPSTHKSFHFAIPQKNSIENFGNSETLSLFEDAVRKIESLGGKRVEIDFTIFREVAKLLYGGPWVAERLVSITEFLKANSPDALLPITSEIICSADSLKATEVYESYYKLKVFKRLMADLWNEKNIDVLVTPTAGTVYKIEEVEREPLTTNSNLGYYTNFVNLLDMCAIAVPWGKFSSSGIPFGITISAPALEDLLLMELASSFTQASS